MKAQLLLVRDGLENAAPSMARVLRDAGVNVRTVSAAELVARVRVVLRFSAWLEDPIRTPLYKDVLTNSSSI